MKTTLALDTVRPQQQKLEDWLSRQFALIQDASSEDSAEMAADAIVTSNAFTERVTFDTSTVTTAQLAEVVATLIKYIKTRGPRKA